MSIKTRRSTGRITGERVIIKSCVAEGKTLDTSVFPIAKQAIYRNEVSEDVLGLFRSPSARKAVIADMELINAFKERNLEIPSFLEAGPREYLRHDPQKVRAAIVTTGGVAPGLHCVIHSIVKRHCHTYSFASGHGSVFGVYDSFRGLCRLADYHVELSPNITEGWLDQGGSKLGNIRYYHDVQEEQDAAEEMVKVISANLHNNGIDILYVIGGDGSLKIAHKIAKANEDISVVGIPKTMDNDILWVWQSFGFSTAVEQATRIINNLHSEAESTRRIGLVELFGADSGFVAANASLASGHVNLVLIPEVFQSLESTTAEEYLNEAIDHLRREVQRDPHSPHAIVVVAEGVAKILEDKGISLAGSTVQKDSFISQLSKALRERILNPHGEEMLVFINQPRHYIRSVPANPHDQIYCERLGALAVDNALAGYSDFMISQWLTEYVLVPLELVGYGQKSIPVNGMFWKQVISTTGQPFSSSERPMHTSEVLSEPPSTTVE